MTIKEQLEKIKKSIESRPTEAQRIAALEAAVTELAIGQIKERDSNV